MYCSTSKVNMLKTKISIIIHSINLHKLMCIDNQLSVQKLSNFVMSNLNESSENILVKILKLYIFQYFISGRL